MTLENLSPKNVDLNQSSIAAMNKTMTIPMNTLSPNRRHTDTNFFKGATSAPKKSDLVSYRIEDVENSEFSQKTFGSPVNNAIERNFEQLDIVEQAKLLRIS